MKIGFIGGGAMGEALIKGILSHGELTPAEVFVSELTAERCIYLHDTYGVTAVGGPESFLEDIDVLFLAVKPQVADVAISAFNEKVKKDTVVVSIIAGFTLEQLEAYFPLQPVVRVMPNTPLMVGEGMAALAPGKRASAEQVQLVRELFLACGRAIVVKENIIDAVTGLSGSGPAYAFLVIDAMADGGVAAGLSRQDAIMLAAQTLLGSAKMVLETGKHPDVLRDQVTSPAGTAIAGVRVLEQHGVRGAFIDAVMAATEKSAAMGKKK